MYYFGRKITRWPVDSPNKDATRRKVFPCHQVTLCDLNLTLLFLIRTERGKMTMKMKGVGMSRGRGRSMERHVINARLNCQCHDFWSCICWFIRNRNFDYIPDMMTSANGCIFRVTGLLWALMVSLICAWRNGWTSYRDPGDLRRHRAHYDVTLMCGYNIFQFHQLLLLQWLKSRPSPYDSQLFEVKTKYKYHVSFPLRWRHNGRDSVSNHQPHDCFLNRLFRRRSKKTSKLRVTLCREFTGDRWIPRTNGQ